VETEAEVGAGAGVETEAEVEAGAGVETEAETEPGRRGKRLPSSDLLSI